MVVDIISLILVLIFIFIISKRMYKKCESFFEKSLFILSMIIMIFIYILYYFDRFNIPSILKWNENVDSQNWLNVLSNFGTTILAEIVGGLILIFVTLMQIEKNNEDNIKRDTEERRINNLPLMQYNIENCIKLVPTFNINTIYSEEESNTYSIVLSIKNIGMGAAKKIYISIDGDCIPEITSFEIANQSSLATNEVKSLMLSLCLKQKKHLFYLTIYYEDLLSNWYSQNLELEYDITNATSFKYDVSDSILLLEKPKI